MDERPAPGTPRFLSSLALISTLSAAVEVHRGVLARRSGQDPSAQEAAATARAHLQTDAAALRLLLVRLRVNLVCEDEAAPGAARRLSEGLLLARGGRLLQRMHQRLLSVYPDVEPALVEAARVLKGRADAIPHLDPGAFEDALRGFVADGLRFLDALEPVY